MSIASQTNLPADAPNWDSISEVVRCPLCEYELRGLIEPRCPECGYQFTWPEVLDADRRPHPYLFEHHPRRNVGSFVRTKLHGFAPWRFWQTLQPTMRVIRRRLLLYWILCAAALVFLPIVGFGQYWLRSSPSLQRGRQSAVAVFGPGGKAQKYLSNITAQYGSLQNFLDTVYPDPYTLHGGWIVAKQYWNAMSSIAPVRLAPTILIFFLWPWLTFATLSIFRVTMARANVKPIHVLRCVLYSCDSPLFMAGLLVLLTPRNVPWFAWNYWPIDKFLAVVAAPCAVLSVLTLCKLGFAYQSYLRFPHAWGTAILSQVVALLTVVSVASAIFQFWR